MTLRLLIWPAFVWIGLMFLLALSLAGADLMAFFLLRRATGGESVRVYVSRCWGPPIRVFAPAEINQNVSRSSVA
jgi:hypothetical protein